jgi:predicted transcriptional regulator
MTGLTEGRKEKKSVTYRFRRQAQNGSRVKQKGVVYVGEEAQCLLGRQVNAGKVDQAQAAHFVQKAQELASAKRKREGERVIRVSGRDGKMRGEEERRRVRRVRRVKLT